MRISTYIDNYDTLNYSYVLCRRIRRTLSSVEIRRAARKPWRRLSAPVHVAHPQRSARGEDMVVILD